MDFKSQDQKDRLTQTIAGTMRSLPKDLTLKIIGHFKKCDEDYGERILKILS